MIYYQSRRLDVLWMPSETLDPLLHLPSTQAAGGILRSSLRAQTAWEAAEDARRDRQGRRPAFARDSERCEL